MKLNGFEPSKQGDPDRWLRSSYHYLTGVPPTLEERQVSCKRYRRLAKQATTACDRLLKSPRFVSDGLVWAGYCPLRRFTRLGQDGKRTMWKYRDWVIKAFNDDMP